MNVLIIGSGGREHVLGWKLKQSKQCGKVYFLPGNAGTKAIGQSVRIDINKINQKSVDEIAWFCKQNKVELVVIGPEDPLSAGLADMLTKAGLKVFGPCKAAAQLEADKAWSKKLMREASVPTAEGRVFKSARDAMAYVEAHETPVVVKAAGLAKGKGVIVCSNREESIDAVKRVMIDKEFGESGDVCVIEERLVGQEVSILALVDGRNIFVLEPSQDHKQVGEGDKGPNTGGMGAYTPTPIVDDAMMRRIEREVLVPTLDALRRDEIEFKGVMYAGLMLTAGGPKVLEYNTRFGDPECQPLMVRMKGDLLEVMLAVIDGRLDEVDLSWDRRVACCVVMCSGGYPGEYRKGIPISGLDEAAKLKDVFIFHAGTAEKDGEVVTAGGRVLNIVALGDDLAEARDRANAACDMIHFDGGFFRRDIGDRVLNLKR
ncbi:MAG: phosphoribosylamine--glycine ligase [Planctomycetes bacterium]|nr:phosphoribosylamine--glycine ligase [Planctomycetota bacterium]